MSGPWINHRQVEVYMKSRKNGYSQIASASRAGISERSGREIESGRRKDPKRKDRNWRTRPDPLSGVWENTLVPLLENNPMLQPITLLEHLQDQFPGQYPDGLLRTLQRRVKQWRALSGPPKEVMFRQMHPPGAQGLSDFTMLKNVTITINKQPLAHRLYHFKLSFSRWSYMKVILGGESYTALVDGLQCALWRLGGCPLEHRTDSLSAAFKNLNKDATTDLTKRYEAFCNYYNMRPTRNNRGKGHENGSIECAHGHLKRRIEQALLLRGSNDFNSVGSYQAWLDDVVSAYNCRNTTALHEEKKYLQKLPKHTTETYSELSVVVTSSSTILIRRVLYTVPSRFIGECLRIRLYDDRIEAYYGAEKVVELPRIYIAHRTARARHIDYRHVIHSLVKKPQAFRHSQLRDDLLPTSGFKQIWAYANATMSSKYACRFIVGLLAIAAKQPSEDALEQAVLEQIAQKKLLELKYFEMLFSPEPAQVPQIVVKQHALTEYDQLLEQGEGQ